VALIPVDLNNLPANNLATLYRVMVRAFYRVRQQFEPALQQQIAALYDESRRERDAFLVQSSLQELLLLFQHRHIQVVLVLNRFDRFCQAVRPHMVNTLRGLRDDFKDTVCYIAGMTQEVAYLPDPGVLGHMYELLDHYICWVGRMSDEDSRSLIERTMAALPAKPGQAEIEMMLALAGGYPALLRAICQWQLSAEPRPPCPAWEAALLAEPSLRYRLAKIWTGLTQEEQFVLSELQKRLTVAGRTISGNGLGVAQEGSMGEPGGGFFERNRAILARLVMKGICCRPEGSGGWSIAAGLIAAYVATAEGRGRGKIWLDQPTGQIYQGQTPLTVLTSLERAVLAFLVKYPHVRHTKTDLIINTWPDELRQQGVTDNSLYQVIFTLRQAIEPSPGDPSYLVTWRGKPEGGYQFFPEGRPG
jgi:DNA-binding response OmpR family regulator